eukprot:150139_1
MANRIFAVGQQYQSNKLKELIWADRKNICKVYCPRDSTIFLNKDNEYFVAKAGGSKADCVQYFKQNNMKIERIFCGAGSYQTFILTTDKEIYCYGQSYSTSTVGLDPNTKINTSTPLKIHGLKAISEMGCGYDYSMALTEHNTVLATEYEGSKGGGNGLPKYRDDYGRQILYPQYEAARYINLNLNMKITKISTAYQHTLFLDQNGKVYSCGRNYLAQLGIGSADNNRNYQARAIPYFQDKSIIDICCGSNHSLALDNRGRAYSWGYNSQYQCGVDGSTTVQDYKCIVTPKTITTPSIKSIKAGEAHSCIVTKKNEYYLFGSNGYGCCLGEVNKNVQCPYCINGIIEKQTGLQIRDIALGHECTVFILNDSVEEEEKKEKENIDQYVKQISSLQNTVTEQQQQISSLENIVSAKQQQIEELQVSIAQLQDDHKQCELEINALKEENKMLRIQNIDPANYKTWSVEQIVAWIISLDAAEFQKYEEKLISTMIEEEVVGEDLMHVTADDVKRWGVTKFKNIRMLLQHIKELTVIKANNEGNDAATAYI